MIVTLAVAIMHSPWDPWRRASVIRMTRELGGLGGIRREAALFRVVKALAPTGPWDTARRAWGLMAISDATHCVLLQDDVTVAGDFLAGLKAAIAAKPDEILGLYCPRKIALEARGAGSSWARIRDGAHGPGIVMPRDQVLRFLPWCAANIKPWITHDDNRVCLFAMANGRDVWCPIPSLVDHAGAAHSTMGHGDPRRVAKWFCGRDRSAAAIDWSRGADDPPYDRGNMSLRSHRAYFVGVPDDAGGLTPSQGSRSKRRKENL